PPRFSSYPNAPHPHLHSFPTRRSSDLNDGRSNASPTALAPHTDPSGAMRRWTSIVPFFNVAGSPAAAGRLKQYAARAAREEIEADRKSTRLNSSHGSISYAVFCLKKKR